MTKAEAIKLIDDRMCFGRGKWSEHHMPEIDDYWKAGQIAIKALEEPERKRGKWIDGHCSNCGCDVPAYIIDWKWQKDMDANFCPNCGADMRGDNDG